MTEMNNVNRGMRILFIMVALAIIAISIKQAQATLEWLLLKRGSCGMVSFPTGIKNNLKCPMHKIQ